LRLACWCSFFGTPDVILKSLPYTAQSPTLYETKEYETKNDLIDEVGRILSEPRTTKFGIGQSLYYQIPLFADPNQLIPSWIWEMLEDYHITKRFNVPIDLETISAWKIDCFLEIEDEIDKCQIHKVEKDGR